MTADPRQGRNEEDVPQTRPPASTDQPAGPSTGPALQSALDTLATLPVGESAAPECGIPGYQILAELGRGAMGVVYRARQVALKRDVALKMILAGEHAGEQERRRFLAEAEVVAALEHPGIVRVHEFGSWGRLPFFIMEFCPGGTLAAKLAGRPVPPAEAAGLVEQLALAVQAAHEKGVVHRDLKPGNVLLDARGQPKVADFGLARRADGGTGLTQTGAVLGTPSYMAPEQARAQKDVGPAADVWALGAILYECLTGKPPFLAATTHETMMRVIGDEPAGVRRLEPKVPRDLEAICLKCLEKVPANRYGSARELADDLRRFLSGEPVGAKPAHLRRVGRWVRRRVWTAAALVAIVAALAAGLWLGGGRGRELSDPGPAVEPVRVSQGPAPKGPPRATRTGPGAAPKGPQKSRIEEVAVKGRRYALLVGSAEYSNPLFPTLKNAENDIKALARVLHAPSSGFAVRLLTTTRGKRDPRDAPTAANIRTALAELIQNGLRHDLVLVALSGHGLQVEVQDPKGTGKSRSYPYFCPADADLTGVDYATGRSKSLINLNGLFEDLGQCGAGAKLVLVDACRVELRGKAPSRSFGAEIALVPRGVTALFSCKPGERSFDSIKLGQSVFFHFVLEALRGKAKNDSDEVTWDQVSAYVKQKVSREVPKLIGGGARQTPHLVANAEDDPVLVYLGKRVVAPPSPKPAPGTNQKANASGNVARSPVEMRKQLADAAREIAQVLGDEARDEVAIREFTGPPTPGANPGAMMQSILIAELKQRKVKIADKAELDVVGEYLLLDEENSNDLNVRLVIAVRNRRGKRLAELNIDIVTPGQQDLVKLLAMTADLAKVPGNAPRDMEIKKALNRPSLRFDGSKIKVSAASPYAVEMLVRQEGGPVLKALPAKEVKGQAFVEIKKGEEYALRLHNTSKSEVAVSVTVDGVDAFHFFEPAANRPEVFLIPPGKTRLISGWPRTSAVKSAGKVLDEKFAGIKRTIGPLTAALSVRYSSSGASNRLATSQGKVGPVTGDLPQARQSAFLVGPFADSAAAKALKPSTRAGTITVCFFPCWEGQAPPGYEGAR
jgi:hypothetical protein